jgi:ectoine hydroxylase-related dioxygenase (phytanoyl-CoA dioxygenase family)
MPPHTPLSAERLDRHLAEIERSGYTILEDVIDPAFLDRISNAIDTLEMDLQIGPAKNDFEGRQTVRIYNLLAHAGVFGEIPLEPGVLAVVEGVLDSGCLVSTLSSIAIGPDETPQLIHSDDQVIGLKRPHQALVCNTMWAVTDFTEANGATRIVPGSHLKDHCPNPTAAIETIPAIMKRGSVLVWHGSLWHGGGANSTDQRRVGIAMNYCAGFIRQQENQQLGVPREVAAGFPAKLKRMLGYGVYRNLIGHVDKSDPIELLGDDVDLKVIWEG